MAVKTSARSLRGYNEKTHTWDWEIHGKRFYASCASLGLPESDWTQEKSRPAAWERYQVLAGLRAKEQAEVRAQNDANLDGYLKIDRISSELERLMIMMEEDPTFPPPQEIRPASPSPPPDKTIKFSVERYVAAKIDDVRSGNRSAGGASNIRLYLSELVKKFGQEATFDAITFEAWEDWQRYCQSHKTEHWKSVYNNSKTFMTWCDQQDLVQLPKNFYNKIKFVFERPEIKTYSDAEIIRILKAATGNLKLCLLLMLNAGMQSKDIGDLKKSEIDLKKGTIKRKRSKTKDKPNTPLVTYPLWRTTLTLLRELINQSPDCPLALTTKSGGKWNLRELREDGKQKRSDNINTLWQNLESKIGQIGTLGRFKKSSATKIRNNPKYSNCEVMFLGHSERNMSGQHYAKITPERLTAAVKWLGDEWHQN